MALLGPVYPVDSNTREVRLDRPGVDVALDALDAKFFEPEAAIDADAVRSAFLEGSR